jgi:hypothetical protein
LQDANFDEAENQLQDELDRLLAQGDGADKALLCSVQLLLGHVKLQLAKFTEAAALFATTRAARVEMYSDHSIQAAEAVEVRACDALFSSANRAYHLWGADMRLPPEHPRSFDTLIVVRAPSLLPRSLSLSPQALALCAKKQAHYSEAEGHFQASLDVANMVMQVRVPSPISALSRLSYLSPWTSPTWSCRCVRYRRTRQQQNRGLASRPVPCRTRTRRKRIPVLRTNASSADRPLSPLYLPLSRAGHLQAGGVGHTHRGPHAIVRAPAAGAGRNVHRAR